jgi:cell division protein FtsL
MSRIEIQINKKIDNSKVIREVDRRCRLEYICLTLLGAVFVLSALLYAWQQYRWVQYGYRIEESQKTIALLEETGRQLRVERASLSNLERIDSIARTRLGMTRPRGGQVVTLDADTLDPVQRSTPETLVARNR